MTAGLEGSCGLTSDSRGYCWGLNNFGQLGDGTRTNRLTPVAVLGGLHFRQLSVGANGTTCGVTTDHLAYCWGGNVAGAFGNGTTTQSSTPVTVGGGHTFLQWRPATSTPAE
jgi:alpha-tubulin suppressor-like RCC1 family protein